jgi:hypothetical protein
LYTRSVRRASGLVLARHSGTNFVKSLAVWGNYETRSRYPKR